MSVLPLLATALLAQPADAGAFDAGEVTDAGPALETFTGLESFEDAPSPEADAGALPALERFATAPVQPEVRLSGFVQAEGAVDLGFDSPPGVALAENILEGRLRARLAADVKVSDRVRVMLEARAQARAAATRDFGRTKAFFEPLLGDAFVDVYTPHVDLRVGNQRVALGANAGFAGADALNPRDLRESVLSVEPDDALLPVFAVRAQGEVGPVQWLAAYVPFFTPHRFFLFGQDESLVQPALGNSLDNRRVEPSVEDFGQERFLETARPPAFLGDVALRVRSSGKLKLGLSWVWMNEKLPRVKVDPELSRLLTAQSSGKPIDAALAASVANRLQAGETLFQGTYARTHLLSAEASWLIGPVQADVDVTVSPRQTFMDITGAPLDQTSLSWVLGASQAEDSPLLYAVNYVGLAVFGVGANAQVALLEPGTSRGVERIGWMHLFMATVGYRLFDDKLELSLRGGVELIQRSFALAPKVLYRPVERLSVWLAAELFVGPPLSPFGYFDRNDRIALGVRWELF